MSLFAQQALIQWGAFLICFAAGYALSTVIKMPDNPMAWLLLVAVVFVVGFLPFLAIPVPIFGAPVPLTMLLWGVGVGLVVGIMIKRGQTARRG